MKVPSTSLFNPKDLVDGPHGGDCSPAVLKCLAALSDAVRKNAALDPPGDAYNGPLLGDKEGDYDPAVMNNNRSYQEVAAKFGADDAPAGGGGGGGGNGGDHIFGGFVSKGGSHTKGPGVAGGRRRSDRAGSSGVGEMPHELGGGGGGGEEGEEEVETSSGSSMLSFGSLGRGA